MKNFIFIHVMKCGGTTANTALRAACGGHYYWDRSFKRDGAVFIKFTDRSEKYIPGRIKQGGYKAIGGHFSINKYKHLGWPMVTIIRHPVDRVVSFYNAFEKSNEKARVYYKKVEMNPLAGCGIRTFADQCPNQMVMMLGDDPGVFQYIGLQEEMQKSLERMGVLLEININLTKSFNITRKQFKQPISEEDRRYVLERNWQDFVFYEKACKKFNWE